MTIDHLDYLWINGKLVASEEAKISVLTHSLHYSGAVFEGERAYDGKIFKLAEHTNRLIASAQTMHLPVPYNFEQIVNAHQLVINKNHIKDAYMRALIWRGSESLRLTSLELSVNLLITALRSVPRPLPPSVKLHISRWRKPHPNAAPPQAKSSSHYQMMIVSQIEAKELGFDDAILLDWRGFIAECTTTNIFFVKGGQLITPIAETFLNGITRQTVIEIAASLSLVVQEQHLSLEQLTEYDECFITGTSAEIKTVDSIDCGAQKIIFSSNEITHCLQKAYASLVRSATKAGQVA